MKRKALLLLFTATLALAVPAYAQTVLLFGFTGYDYQDPNPDAVNYLAVGEGYKVVGFATSFGALLSPYVDTSTYEYTYHAFNLTVSTRSFAAGFLGVNFLNGGRARYYRDPLLGGTPGTYGTNPPNATAPSTFIDGTMRIGGHVDNFQLFYNFNTNTGNFQGNMTLDEGPDLIYVPSSQYAGWVLGGVAGPGAGAPVPTGYDHQVSGECQIPDITPTTHATWGAVKALYR
jgi:hypothetical protein